MIYCQRLTVKQRLSNLSLILLKLIPEVRSFSTKEKVIKVNLELTNIIEEFSQHEDATSLELKSLTKAQNIIFSM